VTAKVRLLMFRNVTEKADLITNLFCVFLQMLMRMPWIKIYLTTAVMIHSVIQVYLRRKEFQLLRKSLSVFLQK